MTTELLGQRLWVSCPLQRCSSVIALIRVSLAALPLSFIVSHKVHPKSCSCTFLELTVLRWRRWDQKQPLGI